MYELMKAARSSARAACPLSAVRARDAFGVVASRVSLARRALARGTRLFHCLYCRARRARRAMKRLL